MTGSGDTRRDNSGLSPAKQALLKARLARAEGSAGTSRRIPVTINDKKFPATSPQARFWFLHNLHPESAAYNMHVAIDVVGTLDIEKMHDAVAGLIRDNDVLRSRFVAEEGEVWQVVDVPLESPLTYHDRRSYQELDVLLTDLARVPFSLERGPLFRTHVVEVSRSRHVLLLVVHHIVCDEPSIAIMLSELGGRYAQGNKTLNVDDRARFADYATWQRQQHDSVLQKHLPFWTGQLEGLQERTTVPTDRSRTDSLQPRGCIVQKSVPMHVARAALNLAKEEQTTLFTVMTAAWVALLYRYTGHRDVAIGTPASLRNLPELQTSLGLFLNTLVLRAKVEPGASFRDLLQQVRELTIDAFDHQQVPLESIVQELNPPRSKGENPFFDTMIVQESAPPPVDGFEGLDVTQREVDAEVCKFDLTLFFRETPGEMLLSIEYDTGLYDRARISSVLDHYISLVRACSELPEQSIAAAPLLSDQENDWLDRSSAGPWQDVAETPSVSAQVDRHLATRGGHPAITDAKGTVSYEELNRLVSNLHDRLASTEHPPASVSLLLDRDRFAIAAMLAAWRASACYVPLDPDYPPVRIEETLQAVADSDLGRNVVVTTSRHAHLVPDGHDVVLIDKPAKVSDRQLQSGPVASDLAYLIFTSGSSGRPKGVRITHENLRVSNAARDDVYGEPPERFLLVSPLAFDSSVVGVYWTLAGGGTLVLASRDEARDARELARIVGEQRITHTLMLPTLYELVLHSATDQELSSLATVIVAGESCPETFYDAHDRLTGGARLFNEYGPTEGTVWSTVYRITGAGSRVPIGACVPSMRGYVLDESLQPLPPGFAGELCLSGPALSPGYLDEEQTSDAFVNTSIFGESRRLYKTGDRVAFDEQGLLHFLGRIDDQIKIRGHRVELEEINAVLRRQTGVSDSACVFDKNRQAISAFVSGSGIDIDELKALLSESLPAYMQPSHLRVLEEMPRLPNGKLDMKSVPMREPGDTVSEPDAEDYRHLKALWCKHLKLDDVPPDENFFDMGGHSLLAVRLLLDVEAAFKRIFPLATLYDSPTLSGLYARLHERREYDKKQILYPIKATGSENPLYIVKPSTRYLTDKIHPELPMYGLWRRMDKTPRKDVTLEMMAAEYVRALRDKQPSGPYRLAGFSFGGVLAIEMAHQLIDSGEEVEHLILIDSTPPVPEGDFRFRVKRIVNRIRAAESLSSGVATALQQLRNMIVRRMSRLHRRVFGTPKASSPRKPTREKLRQVELDWERVTRNTYKHKPYAAPATVIIPRRTMESDEQQIARWDGILVGPLDVLVIDGPREHNDLVMYPHVVTLADKINSVLVKSYDAESQVARTA